MDKLVKHFYNFDAFRVDVEERQLLHRGEAVQLTPKVFDILLALIENCGHTVGKEELMQKIWTDSFVEEGNLNRNISTLRKVLGDDCHEPRFIKTVPKRGYRFVGEVREIWEDDESLTIENRTRCHLKVREEFLAESKIFFWLKHFRVVAAVVLVFIIGALSAWLWNQTQKSEVRPLVLMKGTENAEAFELYRRGRALWQTRTGENLHEATLLLEQSVERDPNFALARAALADAYAFDYANWKKAEGAAREAVRLDPDLGEPHATIGFVKMFWEWKLKEAEAEFKQAIQLSPNYATAHQWYSVLLSAIDRRNAAYAEMSRALELEPDSLSINADMCQTLYFMRRHGEAEAQCQKVLAMNPNFYNAHLYLYEIYNTQGMFEEAVAEHFKIEELAGIKSPGAENEKLLDAFRTGGIRVFWQMRIDALMKPNPSCYPLAQHFARLGEKDQALKFLRQSYEKREFDFILFFADPAFDDLRGDHRYNNLMNLLYPVE